MLEEIDEFLKLALLERVDLPLILLQLTSIFILESNWAIGKCVVKITELEKYLFVTSLMGTIIQDGGKRERSNVDRLE